MSLKLQKQIDTIKAERDADRKRIAELETRTSWLVKMMKTSMEDVLQKMIENKFEFEAVEKTDDEKLRELMEQIS